mmetsp:Transcript_22939/g.58349  ORF Transcript_22939/g.58349 Transcript_22939/m.58349 type:complete len:287 (-) Transcript_22939:397-1257(-)
MRLYRPEPRTLGSPAAPVTPSAASTRRDMRRQNAELREPLSSSVHSCGAESTFADINRANSAETSACLCRKRPWNLMGPIMRGSTGSKMSLSASWSVTIPTAAPVSARDHHGDQTIQRSICSTPSNPPSTSPELTTNLRSRSPQRSKRPTSTFGSSATPRTTISRRSNTAFGSACTSRTKSDTSACPCRLRVELNAPLPMAARASLPHPLRSARSVAISTPTRTTMGSSAVAIASAGSRANTVFRSIRRSMTSSTMRLAIERALFGTIPCHPMGNRSTRIPRNLSG